MVEIGHASLLKHKMFDRPGKCVEYSSSDYQALTPFPFAWECL